MVEISIGFPSFIRYLKRCKKELILGVIFLWAYFIMVCKGRYLPTPQTYYIMWPYFPFGLSAIRGNFRRTIPYLTQTSNPFPDSTVFDLIKPEVKDLSYDDSPFTFTVPTKYPANDSWSPSMLAFIDYNLNHNPDLTGNDLKFFNHAVKRIDDIAEYSSNSFRRLCALYEQATKKNKVGTDLHNYGWLRLDSAFKLPNNHNSTKVVCKMVHHIKEIALMSKYHLYPPNQMLKDHLKDAVQVMEYLDPKQYELPKYYDSPDFNMVGRLGQDFLRFDQFIMEKIPLPDVSVSKEGPFWWPFSNHMYSFANGKLLKLRSSRNKYQTEEPLLHKDAPSFWGFIRGRDFIERFYVLEEDDVNDQNRFNYGHFPEPRGDRRSVQDWKPLWEESYCPWGHEGEVLTVMGNDDFREYEKLLIESWTSKETQTCEHKDVKKKEAGDKKPELKPDLFMNYFYQETSACVPKSFFGPQSPGWYMDLMRANFPYNDECYIRESTVSVIQLFGGAARTDGWAYHLRWGWHDMDKQGFYEFWLAIVIGPALLCGNHRGKVEHRLNKIHD